MTRKTGCFLGIFAVLASFAAAVWLVAVLVSAIR